MLRFSVRIFSLFGVALLLASLTYAQQPTSPPTTRAEALTNSDVLKMVEAKLTVWKHNHSTYQKRFGEWDRSLICSRCGAVSKQELEP